MRAWWNAWGPLAAVGIVVVGGLLAYGALLWSIRSPVDPEIWVQDRKTVCLYMLPHGGLWGIRKVDLGIPASAPCP